MPARGDGWIEARAMTASSWVRAQALEVKRFLNPDPDEMRQGWEASEQREWNAATATMTPGEAIDNAWSIISPR